MKKSEVLDGMKKTDAFSADFSRFQEKNEQSLQR